ncbi:hypothetical protein F5Y16DRAFT_112152 [Xylariaceae sp. FL0255]|nr:hypothetical protein F5Y16DRAFT_112152 [Xylariaceae sp. FL0255]
MTFDILFKKHRPNRLDQNSLDERIPSEEEQRTIHIFITTPLSTMSYSPTTYSNECTECAKRDNFQTDRSFIIIKSLRLGQAFYSMALFWIEILFLVAWIAPPTTSLDSHVSPGFRAQHSLTLLAGFLSNIHLIIWHISDKFRKWEKTIMIDFTFSVIWLSLTVVATYSHDHTMQDESLMPPLDAAFWRADVVLVVVLGVGSAIFIVEPFVDLFLNKMRTGYHNDDRNETRHSSAKHDG